MYQVRLLQESELHAHDLCRTTQHENMCNLYWCSLANITSAIMSTKWNLTIWSIYDVYKKHKIHPEGDINVPEDTWSIKALTFENGNNGQAYKGHLEKKTTITSIGAWWYLSYEIYGKNNRYVWEVELLFTTKLAF